ncbi:DUF4457-containing protein [Aureococcus anophagefferens]|nr:DUF4457-containing protein [Aureococcus anophagefferens]
MMMQVPVDGPPSPKTAAHMEYLRRLEEATKLKKPRKSAKPVRLAKKEAGFDLHWAGANRQRTGGKLKKAARPLAALAPPENARRTWGRTAARRRAARRNRTTSLEAPAEAVVEEAPAEAAAEAVVEAVVEPFVATVRIRNGWGNARIAGLDGLALVGGDGAVIEVAPDALRLLAGSPPRPAPASSRSAAELARLTAPPASRRRDLAAKSWVARIPTDGPVHVALAVGAGVLDRAGARLRVWNCSASAKAIGGVADEPGALGARSIEVEVDGALVFAGELPRRARDAKGSGWFDVALTAPAAVPAELAAAAPAPAAEAAPTPAEEAPPAPKPAPLETPGDDGRGGRRARLRASLWLSSRRRGAALDLASPPKPKPTPRSRRPRTQGPEEPEDDEAAPAAAGAGGAAASRRRPRRTLSQVLGRARRGAPRELPRRKPRNEASLLESWDSLAQFSSKSRSRLARAGASALGDSFADSVAGAPGDADSFVEDDDDEVFEGVPTLPSGRVLTVQILSTWGDPHYVGLHGLELFDDRGAPVAPVAIAATPSMEGHDPRTPENLCDGVYDTSDELRAWLCPFDAAEPPTVTLELAPASQPPTTLAMLRLWNYNASRTASTRGARFLRCFLDGVKIFEGEVRQAPGTLEDCRDEAECVLFTYDAGVLATIEGATRPRRRKAEKDEEDEALDRLLEVARPSTADRLEDSVADEAPVVARDAGERPAGAGVVCRRLRLRLAATWGDAHWVGLTGLRVLGERGPVELDFSKIAATPRDLKSLGHAGDPRTLDKLFDGCHATRDDAHMWLVPFDGATKPVVDVDLSAAARLRPRGPQLQQVARALRARTLVVEADGAPLRTVELRPAPGRAVDFGQLVSFDEPRRPRALSVAAPGAARCSRTTRRPCCRAGRCCAS